ncbi:hypothetical protein R1flu_006574 [Riccia fluitans]|uniref:Uncharacterized protein n=1 Tax=Riccia fluitans TaxID=41844 RepID=A0ABD1YX83_9MARC
MGRLYKGLRKLKEELQNQKLGIWRVKKGLRKLKEGLRKQKPGIWRLKEGLWNLILKRLRTVKEGLRKLKKLPERWSVWLDIILSINYEAS